MHSSIAQASWTSLFTDRDMFQRLWRGALLQFMAQMCGATAIKYYLPTIFTSLGLSKDLSLMASGIESTLKIGCTIMEMFLVDRVGRRGTLLMGAAIMSVAMLVCLQHIFLPPILRFVNGYWHFGFVQINGALPLAYPNNKNRSSDYACVVFIFFYSFGYSIGFGPNAWVYGTEVYLLASIPPPGPTLTSP
jgi:MFS family permease